jgi:hypothetical protein
MLDMGEILLFMDFPLVLLFPSGRKLKCMKMVNVAEANCSLLAMLLETSHEPLFESLARAEMSMWWMFPVMSGFGLDALFFCLRSSAC